MASVKDTKKVIELATAKLAAASNGTLAIATLEGDAELLALVDNAAILSSLLADRIGKEYKQSGTDYVYQYDPDFFGTAQYDVILFTSADITAAAMTIVWGQALVDNSDVNGFTVEVDGAPAEIASAVTSGTGTTITLSVAVTALQVVTVSYDNSIGTIRGADGRGLINLVNEAVTNNTV